MRLLITLMLASFNLFAAPSHWSDLEVDKEFKITQSMQLNLVPSHMGLIEINAGSAFTLKEITNLDMIKVTHYNFEYKNCPGIEMVTDLEIIPVKNSSPMVEIGAQLTENCNFEVLIENKDLMTTSIFE